MSNMANSLYAISLLEKQGWKQGAGLGKNEHGIKDYIKVVRKNNKTGVGHIPGSDLTNNWWDQMYNNAANQINKNGDDKTKQPSKINSPKKLLYGSFVKGATLLSKEMGHVEEKSSESESEDSERLPVSLTDEQLFKVCGGRTAHKAAGHGLKLNGKLQRIKEQEERYLESLNSTPQTDRNSSVEADDTAITTKNVTPVCDLETGHKKRKKHKKRTEDKELEVLPKKKKKRTKRHLRDEERAEEIISNHVDLQHSEDIGLKNGQQEKEMSPDLSKNSVGGFSDNGGETVRTDCSAEQLEVAQEDEEGKHKHKKHKKKKKKHKLKPE